ncbi:MAG: molybdopterin-dependent oxidoreductase [Candidatus Eisenbacteria bacterium]|nr:molybdopterin-dependent oxidoreductase [Candidatus Eisenbacteria bacterium]
MSDKISRRTFLSAMAVASASALAPRSSEAAVGSPGKSGTKGVRKVATICEMCFWRCGVLASVVDGRVVRVEGNPEHPLNRGRLCARGNAGTGLLYDPDRLKYPMLRTGKRGEGKLDRVSWDVALDFLADKLKTIREKHGPEAVAYFPHGIGSRFFGTLMSAYGTPNSAEPSFAQCRGPRDVGYQLTFGEGFGSPEPVDLANARLVVLIGSHIGENVFTSQVTSFAEGLANGAKLIAVDPRFSTAASKADWWLPIRPGTDIALLLAWIHVLIGEQLYDKPYIAQYATGLKQLAAHVKPFTPAWAAAITDIPAQRIIETARAMGKAKPAVVVHPGRHTTWYGDDTQRARAMAILTALLGSWGRKGGITLSTPIARGGFELPEFPFSERGRADGAGTTYPLASEEMGVTNGLIDATLSEQPYPLKGWIVYGQNVLESIPQPERTRRAIDKLDLLAVIDVMPVEQTEFADVVLPEATYLERYDPPVIAESGNPPFVSVRMPVVEPMYESRPGWWITKELARRLELDSFFPWQTPEEHLAAVIAPMGISVQDLCNRGAISFPSRPYLKDRAAADEPLFATDSGKIELHSQQLAELGADPIPLFTPPTEPPKGYFRLVYGRAAVHSFARTQNNEALHAMMPENDAWLSTNQAAALGLKDGDRVVLENLAGTKSLPLSLRVTEGIREDCLYMAHGFGQRSKAMRRADRRGASDTALMSEIKVDPLMGGTGMRVNFVRPILPTDS